MHANEICQNVRSSAVVSLWDIFVRSSMDVNGSFCVPDRMRTLSPVYWCCMAKDLLSLQGLQKAPSLISWVVQGLL